MQEIVNGCLVSAFSNKQINVLFHLVNCQGVMGKGVAGAIRKEYPEHYNQYKTQCDYEEDKAKLLGKVICTPVGETQAIIGLFGQLYYGLKGRKIHYGHFYSSVYKASKLYDYKDKTIGLPFYIGCGLAGGQWSVVIELLTTSLPVCKNIQFYNKELVRG